MTHISYIYLFVRLSICLYVSFIYELKLFPNLSINSLLWTACLYLFGKTTIYYTITFTPYYYTLSSWVFIWLFYRKVVLTSKDGKLMQASMFWSHRAAEAYFYFSLPIIGSLLSYLTLQVETTFSCKIYIWTPCIGFLVPQFWFCSCFQVLVVFFSFLLFSWFLGSSSCTSYSTEALVMKNNVDWRRKVICKKCHLFF